ncbi:MAG TPA: SCO family protein [Candidatus Angelobacter sp.]|nr:SCO family protein [Candidatus Angelobacter sp.]
MRRKFVGFAAVTAIILTAIFFITASSTPVAASSRYGANYFPNVTLTTQDGKQVHFYDDLLKGKIVVIDLIYTHCVDACPLETARLVQVQKMLGDRVGKDIFFYSISIDPSNDTPKVLKEYAAKYHVGPGWTFLTGKKEDIDLISKKLGLYSEPDPNDRDGHTPSVLIGDEPNGQWIRNGATDNARFLANMIEGWLDNWKSSQEAKLARGETTGVTYDQVAHVDMSDRGRYVFASQCAACHTIGHGDKIGPDLQTVAKVRDHAWLVRMITSPEKMIAEKDPIATALYKKYKEVNMPNLRLADVDLQQLLGFLERQSAAADQQMSGAQPATTKTATQPLP